MTRLDARPVSTPQLESGYWSIHRTMSAGSQDGEARRERVRLANLLCAETGTICHCSATARARAAGSIAMSTLLSLTEPGTSDGTEKRLYIGRFFIHFSKRKTSRRLAVDCEWRLVRFL